MRDTAAEQAVGCDTTRSVIGVRVIHADDSDFMALWVKIGREQQAKVDRVRAILSEAGARYSQIRDGWFRQKGDWDTATEAEITLVETKQVLAVGDIVGIWDCYDKSTRYLSLWTVTKSPYKDHYELEFKETLCSTAASPKADVSK